MASSSSSSLAQVAGFSTKLNPTFKRTTFFLLPLKQTTTTTFPRIKISCSQKKPIRNPPLDKHITTQNKIRFLQKLKTLLLSKPKHFLPLKILSKCRSYLSLSLSSSPKKSLISLIHRYPSIFQLFTLPSSPQPQLCVRLTPAAHSLAAQESLIKSTISLTFASKLQKLLMLSSHTNNTILLSKLVHLAPDLGLPVNFRSRLCNDYAEKFKTIDTSYGRALQLTSWDPALAIPLPRLNPTITKDFIVDRPLKFKHLSLRKGVNLKRRHRDFLIKFGDLPDVSPYTPLPPLPLPAEAAEKRACAVVREVLGMTLEKRTLVDHLTHFRKEFGLSNKVRGMLVRHPELFYVSLKGQRDSVFLTEMYDDKGRLLRYGDGNGDEILLVKEKLMELVRQGKKLRREWRNNGGNITNHIDQDYKDDDHEYDDDDDDGFADLFIGDDEWQDYGVEEDGVLLGDEINADFWSIDGEGGRGGSLEHW